MMAISRNRTGSSQNLDTTVVGLQDRPLALTAPNSGQVLTWDGTQWTPEDVPGGAPPVFVGPSPPASPGTGDQWYDTANDTLNIWDGTQWVPIGGPGDAPATISATEPANPVPGDLWWDTVSGQLFVYYDDGTSSQWVIANTAPPGPAGLPAFTPTTAAFTPPGNGNTVVIDVADTSWMAVGAPLFIDGNTYQVQSIQSTTQVTLLQTALALPPPGPLKGPILGVTDGSDAAPGQVGEFITASGSLLNVASDTWANPASITLQAGDWEVWGYIDFSSGFSDFSQFYWAVSRTVNNFGDIASGRLSFSVGTLGTEVSFEAPRCRYSFTAATPIYLNGYAFSNASHTVTMSGNIYARRMR